VILLIVCRVSLFCVCWVLVVDMYKLFWGFIQSCCLGSVVIWFMRLYFCCGVCGFYVLYGIWFVYYKLYVSVLGYMFV